MKKTGEGPGKKPDLKVRGGGAHANDRKERKTETVMLTH